MKALGRKTLILIISFTAILSFLTIPAFALDKPNEYTFTINVPEASSKTIAAPDGNTYILYSFNNGLFTTEECKPMLPVLVEKVAIPAGAKNLNVRVIQSATSQQKLNYRIYPVERNILIRDADMPYVKTEFCIDEAFYKNTAGFYLQPKVVIKELADFRGLKYAVVEIRPYQYIPAKDLLEITKNMTIKLSWKQEPGVKQKSAQDLNKDQLIKPMLKGLRNLSVIAEPEGEPALIIEEPIEAGIVTYPAGLLTGVHTDYLIVTADDFYNSPLIAELANHRASSAGGGYDVSVVRMQDIYATQFPDEQGNERSDRLLKIFIKYVYDHWNVEEPPVRYILLVGDAITDENNNDVAASWSVPAYISEVYSYDERIAADFSYGCVSREYPYYLDNESYYDIIGDIAIGRFPVRNEIQLLIAVDKTIRYETVFSLPGAWHKTAALFSGFTVADQDFSDIVRYIYGLMRDNYLVPNGFDVLETYRVDFSNDDAGTFQFRQEFFNITGQGASIQALTGHGFYQIIKWGLPGHYNGFDNFRIIDIPYLNNANGLPLFFTEACYTGYFDHPEEQSLAEALLVNDVDGAIMYMGSSRLAAGTSIYLTKDVIAAIFDGPNPVLGSAVLSGKNNAYYKDRLLYNMIGDPALNISSIIEAPAPDNVAPVIAPISNQIARINKQFSLNITATDADGDRVYFTAIQKPAWLILTDNADNTATLSGKPSRLNLGNHIVRVQATDGIIPEPVAIEFNIKVVLKIIGPAIIPDIIPEPAGDNAPQGRRIAR